MSTTVRFGRWTAELYLRTLHIVRGPVRHCPDCSGTGGIDSFSLATGDPETELCDCWDPAPVLRIPLWFPSRSQHAETEPF